MKNARFFVHCRFMKDSYSYYKRNTKAYNVDFCILKNQSNKLTSSAF